MKIRFILFLCLFLPFFSCGKQETPKSGKPTVLVSVPPYVYFVQKIAKDTVEIETLVPVGANPHIYEATPKDVQRHQNAALWVYLGEPFDKKALQFFQDMKKPIHVVDMAEGTPLLPLCEEEEHAHCCHHHHHHDEGKDLHIWLSPRLAKLQAVKIAEALTSLLPAEQKRFEANLKSFIDELDHLDAEIADLLAPMKGQAILVSHPAFGYFCLDYHLTQLSIEMEGKDPLPQHVAAIVAKAKSYAIHSVITEPQYSNKGAELIAQSLGLPTHSVDPYAMNFSENLLSIAQVIAE